MLLGLCRIGAIAYLLGFFPAFVVSAETSPDTWKAGLARVRITPEVPMPMGGYAGRSQLADRKLHDLWAKALVLQDKSGNRAVLITLDLIGVSRDVSVPVCQQIENEFGLPRASVALSTTHTHTGPVVGKNLPILSTVEYPPQVQTLIDNYADNLRTTLVKLVGTAIENLQPAQLSYSSGSATFAVNRRNNPEPEVPERRAADKLVGPVDHAVPVLAVADATGQLRAIVCGYACHATVLSDVVWTGDWPGFAQLELEKRHPGAQVMVWAGCGADQNPLPRRTEALAADYGSQLADAVDVALEKPRTDIASTLLTDYREIEIPFAQPPSREHFEQELQTATGHAARRAKWLLDQWQREGAIATGYPNYPVQYWKLGKSLEWIFLGGEVVVDYAILLKSGRDAASTWVVGYSNDVMAYIPSQRVLREGGYEGGGAMVYYGLPGAWDVSIESKILDAVNASRASE
jgi:hypothetical protein